MFHRAPMWFLRRLLITILTLLGASILVFVAVRLMPGGYENIVLSPLSSEAARQAAVERYGLDQPVVIQYLQWVVGILSGDLGFSMVSQVPVLDELSQRLPITITLAGLAMFITVVVGIPLGMIVALRATSPKSATVGTLASGLGMSLPEFVTGTVVLYAVSTLLPEWGIGNFLTAGTPGAVLAGLIIPACILSIYCVSALARTTRDATLNVLVEGHISAAVARGERRSHIVAHHIVRNASVPILTLLGTLTAYLLGGAVIVETIFNVPGVGSYMVTGLEQRDYAVVQATVLLAAGTFVVMNTVVELLTSVLDPRIADSRKAAQR